MLGLGQQDRLALVSLRIDEILFGGLGFGIPGIGTGSDARGGRGVQTHTWIGERMLDLGVLRIGRVQILEHLGRGLFVTVVAQVERLGQRAVGGCHFDGTTGVFEVGEGGIDHAELGEGNPQGDPYGVGRGGVQGRIGDNGGQQRDDVGPTLGPVLHGDSGPAGVEPSGAPLGHGVDQLGSFDVVALVHEGRRIGEVIVVGSAGTELEVEPGVVEEGEVARVQVHRMLKMPSGGHGLGDRFEHVDGGAPGGR